MKAVVAFHKSGSVVERTLGNGPAPAEGVLWITVEWESAGRRFRHRLLGADYYWIAGARFGTVCDGSCCPPSRSAWELRDGHCVRLAGERAEPPEGVNLMAGAMLPDDEWARVRP